MGKGINLARELGAGLHADVLDDFKDQLLIVLIKRLAVNGRLQIPVEEIDNTGQDMLAFSVRDRVFHFELKRKVMSETDRAGRKICTTDGRPASEALASQTNATGQHASYIVLCEEERAKRFVRPYRDSYKHVGRLIAGEIIDGGVTDRPAARVGGCGTVTTMGRALSETYARDPKFYGATFCCGCNRHLPVAEFVWTADGQEVGS